MMGVVNTISRIKKSWNAGKTRSIRARKAKPTKAKRLKVKIQQEIQRRTVLSSNNSTITNNKSFMR